MRLLETRLGQMAAVQDAPNLQVICRNDISFDSANFCVSVITSRDCQLVAGPGATAECGPVTKLEVLPWGTLELEHISHVFCTMPPARAPSCTLARMPAETGAGDVSHMDYAVARFVFAPEHRERVLRVRMPGAGAVWTVAHRESDAVRAFAVHFATAVYLDLCGTDGISEPPWVVHVHLNLTPYAFLRYLDTKPCCQLPNRGRLLAGPVPGRARIVVDKQTHTVRGYNFKSYTKSFGMLGIAGERASKSEIRMLALCLACLKPFADDCCMSRAAREQQETMPFMLNLADIPATGPLQADKAAALKAMNRNIIAPPPDRSCYGRMAMYIDLRYQLCGLSATKKALGSKQKGLYREAVLDLITANLLLCARPAAAAHAEGNMQALFINLVEDLCGSAGQSGVPAGTVSALSVLFGEPPYLVGLRVEHMSLGVDMSVMVKAACADRWADAAQMPVIVAVDVRGVPAFSTKYTDEDLDFRLQHGFVYTLCCVLQYKTIPPPTAHDPPLRSMDRNKRSDCQVYHRLSDDTWREVPDGNDVYVLKHTVQAPQQPPASATKKKTARRRTKKVVSSSDADEDYDEPARFVLDDNARRVQILFYTKV